VCPLRVRLGRRLRRRNIADRAEHVASAGGHAIRSDFVLDDWRSNRDDWCITLRRVAYVR
jgi:hypothetical protein